MATNDSREKNSPNRSITASKQKDFSEWYVQVLLKSDFIDYTAVSGCIAFRPSAYFVWEKVRDYVDAKFKEDGIENVYFPTLIPEHLLQKEKEHVEGFTPEVAWVTQTGDTKLEERLAVRPTSEAIMYENLSKWIRSWRDLPMRLNQWNNVLRWEFKHPTPFLRTREFLWNEGHSAFASKEEAEAELPRIMGIYENALKDTFAIFGIQGRKTQKEKFAGAVASFSLEHFMPDGKAIQGPDFHHDEQKFSKAFEISFTGRDERADYVYQNTYAISSREIGVMVATHSDDKGLVLPPNVAKVQVVIVPIYNNETREEVMKHAAELEKRLAGKARTSLDSRDEYSPGWKFNEWELRGVPLRIEIGVREISEKSVTVYTRYNASKEKMQEEGLINGIKERLESIQKGMYDNSKRFILSRVRKVLTYEELKLAVAEGFFAQAPWCGDEGCEDKIKDETGAKATNMPLDSQRDAEHKSCVLCSRPAHHIVNFARSH